MIGINSRGFRPYKTLAGTIRGAAFARLLMAWLLILVSSAMAAQVIADPQGLSVAVRASDGTYEIQTGADAHGVIQARAAAEIDHKWIRSTDYPKHEISQTTFKDALGHGKKLPLLRTDSRICPASHIRCKFTMAKPSVRLKSRSRIERPMR